MANKNFDKKELYIKSEKKFELDGLTEELAKIPLQDIVPILLKVARDHSAQKSAAQILNEYKSKSDFYGVGSIDQREIFEFGLLFYSVLPPSFAAVELSPISPLGLNSVLTKVSQDITLATIRGSEVIGDSTTPLVLECASRREKLLRQEDTKLNQVELATMKRVLRLQPFDKGKGYMQHFNLLGLCSAGQNIGNKQIIIEFTKKHISIWLDFIEKLNCNGYSFDNITVKLSDVGILEDLIRIFKIPREIVSRNTFNENFDLFKEYNIPLPKEVRSTDELDQLVLDKSIIPREPYLEVIEKGVMEPLKLKYPKIAFTFDIGRRAGIGYYNGICFHIYGTNYKGETIQIVDGGSVDWLSKITSNNKERAITSGFGAELIQKLFRKE